MRGSRIQRASSQLALNHVTVAARVKANPRVWANRLGGPGTDFTQPGNSLGPVTTATRPRGEYLGPPRHAREESVGEYEEKPRLPREKSDQGQAHDAESDGACGRVVHRVRKGEEPLHSTNSSGIINNPLARANGSERLWPTTTVTELRQCRADGDGGGGYYSTYMYQVGCVRAHPRRRSLIHLHLATCTS